MSINIRLDKLWYIHTMEFLLHSDLKKDDWCMQQYRWVSQSKWWAKEAKHKRSYVGWLFIYNSRTNKINLWSEVRTVFKRHKTQRQWYPTPVLLLGKSHGQRSLVGCCPGGLLRVRHNWVTSLSLFTFMHWRRKWQPTPVFLPGESQWGGSLVGCRLWGRTESDTTEVT